MSVWETLFSFFIFGTVCYVAGVLTPFVLFGSGPSSTGPKEPRGKRA